MEGRVAIKNIAIENKKYRFLRILVQNEQQNDILHLKKGFEGMGGKCIGLKKRRYTMDMKSSNIYHDMSASSFRKRP